MNQCQYCAFFQIKLIKDFYRDIFFSFLHKETLSQAASISLICPKKGLSITLSFLVFCFCCYMTAVL